MPGQVDLKAVLLGKEYGGKTSLIERFAYDRFNPHLPYQNTIGGAYLAKKMEVDHKNIIIGIWDTAGSERYEAMSRMYYRNARAAIICYDVTDKSSFERASFWISEIRGCEEGCKIYLCATKIDLIHDKLAQRAVDQGVAEDYADEVHAVHFETSSKTAEGVQELFQRIAQDYVDFQMVKVPASGDQLVPSSKTDPDLKEKCCSVF